MDSKSYLILDIIKNAGEPIPAKDIQSELHNKGLRIDIKTIYEKIKKMNEFYYPILDKEYISVIRRKGYVIASDYFDDGQIQYLIDSICYNKGLNTIESNTLIDRLLTLSSTNQKSRLLLNFNVEKNDSQLLLNLNILLKAIKEESNVYFEYVDYKVVKNKITTVASKRGNLSVGDNSFYCVSPYKIVMNAQHYYLLGYCDKRPEKLSIYRLDRISLLRKHSSEFIEISEQFDMEQEVNQSVNMFMSNDKIDLKIKFNKKITREVVARFGKEYSIVENGNNYVCTICDVTYSKGLIGWILMLQDQIEVIEPYEVRNELKEKIIAMLKSY